MFSFVFFGDTPQKRQKLAATTTTVFKQENNPISKNAKKQKKKTETQVKANARHKPMGQVMGVTDGVGQYFAAVWCGI